MPIYEYSCKRCGHLSQFIERLGEWKWKFWKRRCKDCGSIRLKRVFSTFSTSFSRSTADALNEMSGMGPVNFVSGSGGAAAAPSGPPPGGCPYGVSPPGGAADSRDS